MISFVLKPSAGKHFTKKNSMVIRRKGKGRFIGQRDEVKAAERDLHLQAKALWHGGPLEGPLYLGLTFSIPFPKGDKMRVIGAPYSIRPDGLNLAALVSDALEGVCYLDDEQLVTTTVTKQWAHECSVQCVIEVVTP